MKKVLFFTFISVFAATAIITLLGVTGGLTIKAYYLDRLFGLLVVEAVAPVIALFKKTNFFGDDHEGDAKINVMMLPRDSFPMDADPHQCTITVFNMNTDEETEIVGSTKRANGHLSMFLDSISDEELIKVKLVNTSEESWESEYFNPSIAKAELVRV